MTEATILIADDDAPSAKLLKRMLTREGHHATVVTSAAAALASCSVAPPDLVLIDLIAHGDGFRVCRSLKEQAATRLIPVVIVTSQFERDERLRAIESGADVMLSIECR